MQEASFQRFRNKDLDKQNFIDNEIQRLTGGVKRLDKRLALLRLLIEKGADVNARCGTGASVLYQALKRDDDELVNVLRVQETVDIVGEESSSEKDS